MLKFHINPRNSIIHCNKSASFLQLEQYENSLKSAVESIALDPYFSKAHFRKGLAEFHLGMYENSIKSFNTSKLLTNTTSMIETIDKHITISETCLQNTRGIFDFISMRKQSKTSQNIDCGDYINDSLQIIEIEGKGVGIKTLKEINAGTILLVSKAIHIESKNKKNLGFNVDHQKNMFQSHEEMASFKHIMRKIAFSSNIDFFKLSDGKDCSIKQRINDKNRSAQRVMKIVQNNSFGSSSADEFLESSNKHKKIDQNVGTGVWMNPSFINHSCNFNWMYEVIGDVMVIRNVRSLKKDEEITITYIDVHQNIIERRKHLECKNFICTCETCEKEISDLSKQKAFEILKQKIEKKTVEFRQVVSGNHSKASKLLDDLIKLEEEFYNLKIKAMHIFFNCFNFISPLKKLNTQRNSLNH
eukprot:gene11846-5176_t